MDTQQLRELIIEPTLKEIGLYSEQAVKLLLGTAAQESHMGKYIMQVGGGPAMGIYQMEPATHDDIWDNYLKYKGELAEKIGRLSPECEASDMIHNLKYATAMARLQYYRFPESLPDSQEGMAALWKKRYNTPLGAGTEQEFLHNYERLC